MSREGIFTRVSLGLAAPFFRLPAAFPFSAELLLNPSLHFGKPLFFALSVGWQTCQCLHLLVLASLTCPPAVFSLLVPPAVPPASLRTSMSSLFVLAASCSCHLLNHQSISLRSFLMSTPSTLARFVFVLRNRGVVATVPLQDYQ